jgi:YVTN family beta-propeller protein
MTDTPRPRPTVRSQAHRRQAQRIRPRWLAGAGVTGLAAIITVALMHGGGAGQPASSANLRAAAISPAGSTQAPVPTNPASPGPTSQIGGPMPSLPPSGGTLGGSSNVYANAGVGMFSSTVSAFPPRVYVPDELNGTVIVIDPLTYKILFRYSVGASPEHVTPDWDLQRLYVEAAFGNRLTVIDPRTGRVIDYHSVPGPYNLYFTPNGKIAIVVRDAARAYGGQHQLYFYDRRTWHLIKAVQIPWAGADHLDFSADGSYFLLSTEYAGWVAKVSVAKMQVVDAVYVGGHPIDVRLAPDGKTFFVADYVSGGVSIIDPVAMRVLDFIKTGRGAHGLSISRDDKSLYVTNRLAGSLSVIDILTRRLVHTWSIGGTPDMIAVSPDGTQLWISNRYSGSVTVMNAHTGHVIIVIHVGGHPHGLAYFPEPGRYSLGHNGIYR